MSTNETIGQDILRTLRRLVVATVVLYVALIGLFAVGYLNAQNQREALEVTANSTHDALCTFVDDLEARAEAAQQFLEANPNGIPGIPAAQIQQSIVSQLATLESLSELDCG